MKREQTGGSPNRAGTLPAERQRSNPVSDARTAGGGSTGPHLPADADSKKGMTVAGAAASQPVPAGLRNRKIAAGAANSLPDAKRVCLQLPSGDSQTQGAASAPSRGLRNRNPGNIRRSAIRYRGEVHPSTDPAFKQFETIAWGYRAIFVLLHTYRVRYGRTTPAQMIARWAPPAENDTAGYVRAVCGWTGLMPDRRIDTRNPAVMIPLAAAVSRVENGRAADLREVKDGWALFEQYPP